MKAQFKLADREHAAFCVIVGDDELKSGQVVVKDMRSGEQVKVVTAGLKEILPKP